MSFPINFPVVFGAFLVWEHARQERNMKQFTRQHTHKKEFDSHYNSPTYCVIQEKKISDWLQNCFHSQKFVSCDSSIFTQEMSVTGYFAANHFVPLAGHGRKRQFWKILFQRHSSAECFEAFILSSPSLLHVVDQSISFSCSALST